MNPIPPAAHPEAFSSFSPMFFIQCTLHVPVGSLQAYKNAEVWKNFKNIVENDFHRNRTPYRTKQKFSEIRIALHFEISNRIQI